jgi:flagellar assembly protein FliH
MVKRLSDLYKNSDVVLMNDKYYISFTESHSDAMGYDKYKLHDADDLTGTKMSDEIIRNAESEAERITSEAKLQADIILKQAMQQKEEQFKDGYAKGMEKAEKEYSERLKTLNDALTESLQAEKEMIEGAEQQTLMLSVKIAEKIIHEKILLSENSTKSFFENSIEDILRNDFNVICVRMNKYNIENLYPDWEIEKFMLNIKHDARLDNNSCIVETETGDIDISVFTQLSEVSRKLISIT